MENVYVMIQAVTFDEHHKDYFNVTLYSFPESATYANLTKITCRLVNGTVIERSYPSIGIMPNTTKTFKFNWNWTGHEEEIIELKAYFLQEFETSAFTTQVIPEFPSTAIIIMILLMISVSLFLSKRLKKEKARERSVANGNVGFNNQPQKYEVSIHEHPLKTIAHKILKLSNKVRV